MSMHRLTARCAGSLAPLAVAAIAAACGSTTTGPSLFGTDAGDAASDASLDAKVPVLPGDAPAGDSPPPPNDGPDGVFEPSGPVKDFPAPVFDGTAPKNAPTLFGPPGSGAASGGPCLIEPESDVLYPQNWLRPRFTWVAAGGQNLFELRLHVKNQLADLVVYTSLTQWTMPRTMWNHLRAHSPTEPMTLTVTGGVFDGTTLTGEARGSSYPIGIAPVQATGAIVYWTTSAGTALKGFSIGDESVVGVLTPGQVAETTTTCIGCHTSAPGGEYVAFGLSASTGWPNAMALIDKKAGTVGAAPGFLAAGGAAALARPNQGISTFSLAHWAKGDRRTVLSFDDTTVTPAVDALQWIDLEAPSIATATGTLARTGDARSAGAPSWSHDGKTIAYVSTDHFCDGRLGAGCDGTPYNAADDPGSTADLYTVPYAGGAGGKASPVTGASNPALQEYYPAFTPDDTLLAFDAVPNDLNMYNQAQAELEVVPAGGGTATRLEANDPPACSGKVSPGVTNSWPKWGPTALVGNGSTYYWLVFSSTRAPAGNPQLYITSVVRTGAALKTHGALYLWNQPSGENNHTPAWDTFKVPPVPPPPPPPK